MRKEEVINGLRTLRGELANNYKDNQRIGFIAEANRAIEFIHSTDEPEVLSSDWIKDNQLMWASIHGVEYYVPANKLYGKTVPEQGKSVGENIGWALNEIDKYLSIEGNNEARNALVFAKGVINQLGHKVGNLKYYVLDTEDIPMLVRTHGVVNRANTHLSIHKKGRNTEHYHLTEQEIKDYDKRFWPFAVKVEELEE